VKAEIPPAAWNEHPASMEVVPDIGGAIARVVGSVLHG
jgi:hypothetical protein